MLETDRGLKDRKLAEDGAQLRVGAACDSLEIALREHIERDGHLEGGNRDVRIQRDVPVLHAQPVHRTRTLEVRGRFALGGDASLHQS